jgi:signal transduction histidine kinase
MKIRHKLTLRYAVVTVVVFSAVVLAVYLFSERTRESEFYRDLTREAITKANLFLDNRVDAGIMQLIYRNNRNFIDEVEVAVYTPDFELLYHDAQEIDIIKETPQLINAAMQHKRMTFCEGDFQAIAMAYTYNGCDYVVTAAAYDGYGYAKQNSLAVLLVILWLSGIFIIAIIGHLLARAALRPVSRIVDEVDIINEANLDTRLAVKKEHDELDELSETFNKMLDRLEQSFNNQKMFVSNAAHELRTPLAALIAELEVSLLRDRRTNEAYRTIISNALEDAKNLKHLTAELLDLAKANYDSSQIAKEELRLDELLLDARSTALKAHSDYTVELLFARDADDDSMITVNGNEYLLKIAFLHLMENNCKFSDNKRSFVQISFFEDKSIVRFSDTGIGIAAEEADMIFTPFYRGTNSGRAKGHGIGMALTQKIIHLHNGTITVNSAIGEGTTFVVEVPHL